VNNIARNSREARRVLVDTGRDDWEAATGPRVGDNLDRRAAQRTAELKRSDDLLEQEIKRRKRIGSVQTANGVTAHQRDEQALREESSQLAERVREMKCLCGFTTSLANPGASLAEVCQGLVDIIPSGWQYPEITCARLVLGDHVFRTARFKETPWKLSSRVLVSGKWEGTLEVAYLEARPEAPTGEGPFLKEKRTLLDTLAGLLGEAVERKRVEEYWRESQKLATAVFDSLSGHFAVVDRSAVILAVNEAWLRFAHENGAHPGRINVGVNYLEVCRQAITAGDASAAEALAGIEAVLRGSRTEFALEYRCPSPVTDRWFEMVVHPLNRPQGGAVITHTNITKRRQAEIETDLLRQELFHVTRVTMMGELTASFAHELNQPLTAILSNAQAGQRLLAAGTPDWQEFHELLGDIIADDQRATQVIRRLHALLKKGVLELQSVDLNDLIRDAVELVRSEALIHEVSVALELTPDLPPVQGDRIQLQQVILNLLLNALEAMKNADARRRTLVLRTNRSDAHAVQATVQDAGDGIPPENIERIFDPFYTSKREGMGMGLTICRSIVLAHSGRIWARNNPDHGATFYVALPIAAKANL
jgi:signal transduction histidine kinase